MGGLKMILQHLRRGCVVVTFAVAAFLGAHSPASAVVTLTGLVEFSTDASGNLFSVSPVPPSTAHSTYQRWNTRGGDNIYNLSGDSR